jgi:CDGSH-type Zn-finger protein
MLSDLEATVSDETPFDPANHDLYVRVIENGPYQVFGATSASVVTIVANDAGESWDYATGDSITLRDGSELCRCGHSQRKPLCDKSHEQAGVDVTETAPHTSYADGAEANEGPDATLFDNSSFCAHARFCDAGNEAWGEVEMAGAEHVVAAERMVFRCPGGRLTLIENTTSTDLDPTEEQSISVIEDPLIGASGPIMLRGGVTVVGSDGRAYEVRNRQALCRCGQSSNKPFCDGSHDSR